MQLHIRLKWSKVRPWKGVGIYHTQCSCAQLSLAPVTRRLFGSVLKPELSLLQKTWHCSPKNPKTNINNDKKQNKKHTATHKKAQYKNTQKKLQQWCFLPCFSEILLFWDNSGKQICFQMHQSTLCLLLKKIKKIPVFQIFLLSFVITNAPSSALP